MKNGRKTKLIAGLLMIPIIALLCLFLFTGENVQILKTVFTADLSNDEIQDMLSEIGWRGYITIAILAMLQVVVAVLPAEPVQVIAGLTFGLPIGILCCTVGVIIGNTIIYILYKIYGDRMSSYFDKKLDIDVESAGKTGKIAAVIFILYFLPAIPYGMICFLAATMKMKYPRYITVTTLGAIPSVFIGVGLGHVALASSWIISVCVFVVLVALLTVVMIKRDYFVGKVNSYLQNAKKPYSSKTVVRPYSVHKLNIAYAVFRILSLGKIKFVPRSHVEKIESPSIVLSNHGAFIDFAYAGTLLKNKTPNFVVARMYFYKKLLGNLLRAFGCFPKSMFTTDTESAMNCLRVIRKGRVLAMMPEARLSTVGKFEDIQPSTYDFLKKMGVHVYVIKIRGDYLAKPKWATGIRRGSLVEADLELLFTPDMLSELSVESIGRITEEAMQYNELEWLNTHPEIRYRSKKMAEGLENILTRCPECGARYSIRTKGRELCCERCSLKVTVDQRYSFPDGFIFKSFVEWYDWQTEKMREDILSDESFSLSSEVILKHSSIDGRHTLRESGRGVCRFDRSGLTYKGTEDGAIVEKTFDIDSIYRILFGAGENFELYLGSQIYYFAPTEPRSCVDWYIASGIIKSLNTN